MSLKSISLDGSTVELITTFVIGKRWGIGDRDGGDGGAGGVVCSQTLVR